MPHQSLQFRIIISIGCQRAPSPCSNSMPATFLLDAPGVRPTELDANAHFCSSSPRPFCVVKRGGGRLKSQTASQSNAQYKLRNNASRFRKGPTCVWLGFAPGPTPSCLIHRKSRGLRNRSIFLTMLFCAATAATCFGVSTYKDSGRLSFTKKETAVKATTSTASHESFQPQPTKITNIAVVIGSAVSNFEVSSHFGPPWEEVLSHINRRLSWLDYDINLITVRVDSLMKDPTNVLKDVSMVVAVGIKDNEAAEKVVEAINSVPSVQTLVSYDSAQPLLTATRMNDLALRDTSQWTMLQRFFDPSGFAAVKKYRAAVDMAVDLFQRKTSDDFLFSFLVLINEAVRPIPDVTNSTKRQDAGLPELKCMIGHCGSEILSCMIDSTCRMALSCLNSCAFNDQVRQTT